MKTVCVCAAWLLAAPLLLMGCNGGSVPLEAKIKRVERNSIEISVKSDPGQTVKIQWDKPIETDDKGRAKIKVAVPTEGEVGYGLRDGRIEVKAVHTGLMQSLHDEIFGRKVAAMETLKLTFDPKRLRGAPESPKEAWVRPVGWSDSGLRSLDSCLKFSGELGTGLIEVKGGVFLGPPGAKVSIGEDTFKIKKTGLGTWKPPADIMFTHFPHARPSVKLPIKVQLKGRKTMTTSMVVELDKGCKRTASKQVRKLVRKKKALPGATGEVHPFVLLVRGDDTIETLSPIFGAARDKPPGSAKYIALEEDKEKGATVKCTKAVYYNATHDQLIDISKTPIDTRVQIYEMPGFKKLASKKFKADANKCDSQVRVSKYDLEKWLREIVKGNEPEPVKKGRRRRR